ncbi:hypothetical protein NP233_g7981 [Leucocoprinus birnbaumii]|uniref:Glucose receptor Git3 N-terminal domain-containing protein n=1 Tax=Leucocoprinus birnbaumii TaxID=56174 RepID=A0AAD5VTN8_9AGAR|nr:hypothetical protein NP233_g7981 [Leucocoprinus birnbaumii]
MAGSFCPANRDHHAGLFSFGERLGIFMTILAALLSIVSASGLLLYAILRRIKRRKSSRRRTTRHSRSRSDASGFSLLISLVTADLIQAMGGMPSWRWMLDAQVMDGPSCTFQGAFLNVGNVAIALSSLSIAVHTFVVLVLHWRVTRLTLRIVVGSIWVITAIIIVACGRGRSGYYGDTGYWCWITEEHCPERVVGEYLWMWIAFFIMIGLYVYMFFMMLKGTIRTQRNSEKEEEEVKESRKMAYSMLFYPAVYLFCLAPVSISRWLDWSRASGNPLPPAATLFSNTVFSLSGFLNLILFTITRPTLITGDSSSVSSVGDVGGFAMEEEAPVKHTHGASIL